MTRVLLFLVLVLGAASAKTNTQIQQPGDPLRNAERLGRRGEGEEVVDLDAPGFEDEAFWMTYEFANSANADAPATVNQVSWKLEGDAPGDADGSDVEAVEVRKVASREFINTIEALGAQKGAGKNVYLIIGSASGGYNEDTYEGMMQRVKKWANKLDKKHPQGWLFATNGDAHYGHVSLESIASYLANARGTKGIVVQSDCYHAEIGSAYYPNYASAAIFGPTVTNAEDEDVIGGFADVEEGTVSFPDSCFIGKMGTHGNSMDVETYGYPNLAPYFAGIIAGGGGPIAKQQFEVLKFGTHDNDLVIYTKEGPWKDNKDGICEVAEYVDIEVGNDKIGAQHVFDFEQMEAAKQKEPVNALQPRFRQGVKIQK